MQTKRLYSMPNELKNNYCHILCVYIIKYIKKCKYRKLFKLVKDYQTFRMNTDRSRIIIAGK